MEINNKKSNKKYVILSLILVLLLLLGVIFIFFIYPMFNKTPPVKERKVQEVRTTDITSSVHLNENGRLILNYNDTSVTFSSYSNEKYIGSYLAPKFIYGAKGNTINNVTITYTNSKASEIDFVITICDQNGDNKKELSNEEVTKDNNKVTYSINDAIYIYSVDISYMA